MYKDTEKRKEASRERMRKMRAKLHPGDVTPEVVEGVTPYPEYSMTDYRYYLTPPNTDRIPADYVNKFRSLPSDVQRGIALSMEWSEKLEIPVDVDERIDRAVYYQEYQSARKLPERAMESVK